MKKIIITALLVGGFMSVTGMASNDQQYDDGSAVVPVAGATQAAKKVDINSANVAALAGLHGLAETKAKAIVDYRQQHGSFKSVDDLTKVKGIGDKLIAKLQAKNPGQLVCNA